MKQPRTVYEWSNLYFRNGDRNLSESKAVMGALMSYADNGKLTCYPSQKRLAKNTGLSLDSVQRHLKKNVDAGWLKVLVRGTSVTSSSVYLLTVPDDYPQGCGQSEDSTAGMRRTTRTHAVSTGRTGAAPTTHVTTQRTTHAAEAAGASDPFTDGSEINGPSFPSIASTHVPTDRTDAASCGGSGADSYEPPAPRHSPEDEIPF